MRWFCQTTIFGVFEQFSLLINLLRSFPTSGDYMQVNEILLCIILYIVIDKIHFKLEIIKIGKN